MKKPVPFRFQVPQTEPKDWKGALPRRPLLAGLGRHRKIAMLGGASTIRYTPWWDPTWELWAHASCRQHCQREPDLLFDMHPPELWKDPKKKFWDPTYFRWLQQNHLPIMMQQRYPEVPCSIRYPFEHVITEFPRGYMTNTLAYMVALALQEGVTHLGIYGCHYDGQTEYGPQRGCAEYWLGIAEGRGVQVLIPPTCDLLNRPSLLYGYQSHPGGKRDPSYLFQIGCSPADVAKQAGVAKTPVPATGIDLLPAEGPLAPPLMQIGEPPAVERRDAPPQQNFSYGHALHE